MLINSIPPLFLASDIAQYVLMVSILRSSHFPELIANVYVPAAISGFCQIFYYTTRRKQKMAAGTVVASVLYLLCNRLLYYTDFSFGYRFGQSASCFLVVLSITAIAVTSEVVTGRKASFERDVILMVLVACCCVISVSDMPLEIDSFAVNSMQFYLLQSVCILGKHVLILSSDPLSLLMLYSLLSILMYLFTLDFSDSQSTVLQLNIEMCNNKPYAIFFFAAELLRSVSELLVLSYFNIEIYFLLKFLKFLFVLLSIHMPMKV